MFGSVRQTVTHTSHSLTNTMNPRKQGDGGVRMGLRMGLRMEVKNEKDFWYTPVAVVHRWSS